jgi:transcription elongation factor SPT6
VDHLTVTWKVTEGVHQHIDVKEKQKENAFSLGKSLWINGEEYEDLDEIVARHVNPMAAHARDILTYKYYRDTQGGNREVAEEILREEKRKAPSKIPYIISVVAKVIFSSCLIYHCKLCYNSFDFTSVCVCQW